MKKMFVFCLSLVLLASLTACNMPAESTGIAPELQTAAALTVQAVLTPLNSPTAAPPTSTGDAAASETPGTPLASPTAGGPSLTATPTLGTATVTMTLSLTPTITPTYSTPFLTFKESTNCRSGPGQSYEILYTFLPDSVTEIVAAYPQDGYWVVKQPGSNDTCWAWGGYATTSGSYWVVPSTTPPATRTASPPSAPSGLSWNYACGAGGDITVDLKWIDRSDGEDGFRVVRDDEVIAQLPPNTNSYTDVFYGSATENYSYYIEVYSGTLTARSNTIKFSCQ
ncbi:MAG: hypothetical protein HY869_08475 [Chloroflexi bacterium]|nr:hypothetical protein [Chloroflexota bacterium]